MCSSDLVEPDRFSWNARRSHIKRRIRRYGLVRVMDELAFQAWFRFFDKRLNEELIASKLPERFLRPAKRDYPAWAVPDRKSVV